MAATRIQRQISRLLGQAEKAVQERAWGQVLGCAQDALTLDPGNADAQGLLAAAKRALDISPAAGAATQATASTADGDDTSQLPGHGTAADSSAELYRIVAENMAEGVSVAVDGKREYVNKAFLDIYGLDDPSQAIGKGIDLLVAPEDRQRVWERALARQLGERMPPVVEYRIIRPDGDQRLLETNITHINYRGRPGVVALFRDITAVREAENALRQSEELYRAVAESMRDGISINVNDKRVYVNQAFLDIHGLTDASQAIGKRIEAFYAPEELQHISDLAGLRRSTSFRPRVERRIIRPDGESRHIETLATSITYRGEPARLVVLRDITERKQIEEALEWSEELYRAVAENMTNGISINVDDKRVYVNQAFLDIHGLTDASQAIGMPVETFYLPEEHPIIHALAKERRNGKPVPATELHIRRPDGELRTIQSLGTPITFHGVLARLVVFSDITDRKQAEEALERSEELYRSVAENMMDGISINVDDKRVYVNPAFLTIFGFTDVSEALGIPIEDYFSPEDQRVLKGRSKARRTGDVLPKTERRIITSDGEERIIDTLASPITYGGAPARLVVFRDITDRKEAEAELKAMQASLAQAEKLTAIGQLVAGVAHELNNPLTGVLGFSELLLQTDLAPEVKNSVRVIASEAERAAKVVRQLLSFARKEDSQLAFVNLNQLLAQTIELKQHDMRMAGIEAELELGAAVPPVTADINQLQSVFLNLINNAQFAMTEANGSGKLLIKTSVVKDLVRVSVADDGPGVKAEDLPKLFDPFFTTKDIGQGTGMGLSICHGIITGLGGRIWAESRPNHGTTFYVEIPAAPTLQGLDGPAPAATAVKRKGSGQVFVVDDEPAVRQLTAAALTAFGYNVETSGSAQEAMVTLREANPDVVLLDMRMPGIDGRGMWRMLQESRPDLLAKVVWATGAAIDSKIVDFIASTGRPVLDKPFKLAALEITVGEVIEGKPGA